MRDFQLSCLFLFVGKRFVFKGRLILRERRAYSTVNPNVHMSCIKDNMAAILRSKKLIMISNILKLQEKYGSDKPDLRNPLVIEDFSNIRFEIKYSF